MLKRTEKTKEEEGIGEVVIDGTNESVGFKGYSKTTFQEIQDASTMGNQGKEARGLYIIEVVFDDLSPSERMQIVMGTGVIKLKLETGEELKLMEGKGGRYIPTR